MWREFNSYGSRRGNHEVMMRGTFANIRIKNLMPGHGGRLHRVHVPSGEVLSDLRCGHEVPRGGHALVVVAGKEYGTGSSRDWAAKGTRLLGVRAVIAESFERIHRSNLIGMGVLPLAFPAGESRKTLALRGDERIDVRLPKGEREVRPRQELELVVRRADGSETSVRVLSRLDTDNEIAYFRSGGILQYVLNNLVNASRREKASA